MKKFNAVVIDPVGLHARPATLAVSASAKFKCAVTVEKAEGGKTANMKSIVVTCDGEDEDVAIETIEKVLREQNVIA